MEAHDSVAIVLYHVEKRCMLMVRQFRPALYAAELRRAGFSSSAEAPTPPTLVSGFSCELCAGIVDKSMSLGEIAKEEVLEECGYDVPVESIRKLTSFAASVGVQGSTQTLFYAEVDESMKVQAAGGLAADGERIELLGLPLEHVEAFIMDDAVPKTSGAMFGLLWAKNNLVAAE